MRYHSRKRKTDLKGYSEIIRAATPITQAQGQDCFPLSFRGVGPLFSFTGPDGHQRELCGLFQQRAVVGGKGQATLKSVGVIPPTPVVLAGRALNAMD